MPDTLAVAVAVGAGELRVAHSLILGSVDLTIAVFVVELEETRGGVAGRHPQAAAPLVVEALDDGGGLRLALRCSRGFRALAGQCLLPALSGLLARSIELGSRNLAVPVAIQRRKTRPGLLDLDGTLALDLGDQPMAAHQRGRARRVLCGGSRRKQQRGNARTGKHGGFHVDLEGSVSANSGIQHAQRKRDAVAVATGAPAGAGVR